MRADYTARGPGKNRTHWFAGSEFARDDSAGGLHHVERAAMFVLNRRFQAMNVPAGFGREISVNNDSCGAFVLAKFGQDFVRNGDW